MAMLHTAGKRGLLRKEAEERGYYTTDSYANYGYEEVPFTGDDKPDLEGRLRKALAHGDQTNNRLLWGMSSAGTELCDVRFLEGRNGVAVLRTRYPLGD